MTSFFTFFPLILGIFVHLHNVEANVWTVDCGVLTTQRMDPVVLPGLEPAGHVHAIVGASQFDESATYDDLQLSQCTTCNVAKDKSNYWVPQLYIHKKSDGKFYYVDMDFHVYYKLINSRGQTDFVNNPLQPGEIEAFPPGYRLRAGDPLNKHEDINVNHKCMGPNRNTPGFPPNPENCWAIRSEVTFPSCWNGENNGIDFMEHMAYPDGGWMAGKCPDSHKRQLPTLFFEAIYMIDGIYAPGDELVYSFDDREGFGFHGDFLMGWEENRIEEMLDYCINNPDGMATQCGNEKDGPFHCDWEGTVDSEQYRGVLDKLPDYD